jgi:hypothetical protein
MPDVRAHPVRGGELIDPSEERAKSSRRRLCFFVVLSVLFGAVGLFAYAPECFLEPGAGPVLQCLSPSRVAIAALIAVSIAGLGFLIYFLHRRFGELTWLIVAVPVAAIGMIFALLSGTVLVPTKRSVDAVSVADDPVLFVAGVVICGALVLWAIERWWIYLRKRRGGTEP